MDKFLDEIPGFRSRNAWNMVASSLYYIFCLYLLSVSIILSIIFIIIPFVFFNTGNRLKNEIDYVEPDMEHLINTSYFFIAGASHKNDDGSNRQKIIRYCARGEKLRLVQCPVLEHENAIKVCRENRQCLGWVPRELANDLTYDMKKGKTFEIYFGEVLEPNKDYDSYGAKIILKTYKP